MDESVITRRVQMVAMMVLFYCERERMFRFSVGLEGG